MGPSAIVHAVVGLTSGRVGDDSYLARIIFASMIESDPPGTETGFGISAFITDNEYPIIVIDPDNQLVWLEAEGGEVLSRAVTPAQFVEAAGRAGEDYSELANEIGQVPLV